MTKRSNALHGLLKTKMLINEYLLDMQSRNLRKYNSYLIRLEECQILILVAGTCERFLFMYVDLVVGVPTKYKAQRPTIPFLHWSVDRADTAGQHL